MNTATTPVTATNKVSFKVQLNDDIRRLSVPTPSLPLILAEIKKAFHLNEGSSVKVCYLDDENDLVTIKSDHELLIALSLVSPSSVLKLRTSVEAEAPKKDAGEVRKHRGHHHRHHHGSHGLKRAAEKDSPLKQLKASFANPKDAVIVTQPSAHHQVTLTVTNTGDVAWPQNSYFRFVRKNFFGAANKFYLVAGGRAVQPGESVTVLLDLTAPGSAGRYVGIWRLSTIQEVENDSEHPWKGCFGEPLRVIARVRPSGAADGQEGTEEEIGRCPRWRRMGGSEECKKRKEIKCARRAEMEEKWKTELEALRARGFERPGCMIRLLNKLDGDVEAVAARLTKRKEARATL